MESPTIWVSFLRVPKSPERGNGGYVGFFGGDGSSCNIDVCGKVYLFHVKDYEIACLP
jgi:hypothetical protein